MSALIKIYSDKECNNEINSIPILGLNNYTYTHKKYLYVKNLGNHSSYQTVLASSNNNIRFDLGKINPSEVKEIIIETQVTQGNNITENIKLNVTYDMLEDK